MILRQLVSIVLATATLSACGGSDSNPGNINSSGGGGSTTPDGPVISHLDDGNDCATYYGKTKVNTLIPSELGPCPERTAVICAKCENQYPIVTHAVDGIRSRDEIFSRASVAACVAWADGSTRADECEIEHDGKFTALAAGVGGPSGLTLPEVVPGTLTDGIGPWQFSLLSFKLVGGAVTLPNCSNYYGNGVTDDMRWRGDNVPCPDANRRRTAPSPFVIEGVTAEYVIYND
ncbi:MAG TPA: hypothetical protein VJV79_09395 [Polyangiaceae bacterium]|nr:hypothetical protein [Polyangiaceae bacterium]